MSTRRDILKSAGLIFLLPEILNSQQRKYSAQSNDVIVQESLSDIKKDYDTIIRKILESFVLLQTQTEGTFNGGGSTIRQNYGIGTVFKDYIISLDHIVSENSVIETKGDKVIKYPLTKTSEVTKVAVPYEVPLEEVINNPLNDTAVFRLPKDHGLKKYPYGLGDSDKIKYLQDVLLISMPGLKYFIARDAKVSSMVIPEARSPMGYPGFFISETAVPGESAGLCIDKNTFQILGLIAESHFNGQYGYVRPINTLKPYLK